MINKTIVINKKLSANDLGKTGSHQAGILIPKEVVQLDFFPYLNPEDYNPSVEISFFCEDLNETYSLRYVYYNGKTRNEYRITRMTKLLRDLGATVGDSLAMQNQRNGEIMLTLRRLGATTQSGLKNVDTGSIKDTSDTKIVELKNGWILEEME